MWSAGKSAQLIADYLESQTQDYTYTKNAVIGKISRLGYDRPRGVVREQYGRRKKTIIKRKPPNGTASKLHSIAQKLGGINKKLARHLLMQDGAERLQEMPDGVVVPLNERRNITNVTADQCRWCFGDPQSPDFHFCHHTKIPGLHYCELHAAKVYVTTPTNAFFKK
jgi:GcrA cell cycle regulator